MKDYISIDTLRSYRIHKIAVFDVVATLLVAIIVHKYLWKHSLFIEDNRTYMQYMSSLLIVSITFIGIGIITHRFFNVKSNLSKILGV